MFAFVCFVLYYWCFLMIYLGLLIWLVLGCRLFDLCCFILVIAFALLIWIAFCRFCVLVTMGYLLLCCFVVVLYFECFACVASLFFIWVDVWLIDWCIWFVGFNDAFWYCCVWLVLYAVWLLLWLWLLLRCLDSLSALGFVFVFDVWLFVCF